jgi:O-antigen/teichoic acid export membrane protein
MFRLRILLSVFNRAHAIFAGGTAAAMIFPLISAPILSRLYTPADFGAYAIYFAIVSILTVISSLCMQNAITLEEDFDGQYQALILSCGLTTLFALALVIIIATIPQSYIGRVGLSTENHVERWLPLTVLIGGLSAAFYAWAVKNQRYKELGRNKLILAAVTAALQIGIGFMNPGVMGFVIANLIGLTTSLLLLVRICHHRRTARLAATNFGSLMEKFRRHYKLALWTLPATLVNTVSSNLPDLLIGRSFGTTQLGQYSLANRMINMPLSFVTTSAQEFFRQQASDEYAESKSCKMAFNRFFLMLLLFSVVIIIPMLLIIPYLFPLIFGRQWGVAGELMQCLAFLLIVRFISSPLSYVWIIAGKQREDFLWQIGLLTISGCALLLPKILNPEISLETMLFIYSASVGAWYVLCIAMSCRYSNGLRETQS